MTLYAYRMLDGEYMIRDGLHSRTYFSRERLKSLGARYNPASKSWIGPRAAVDGVGAEVRRRVRVAAHCHEQEQEITVSPNDVAAGFVRLGCGMCDRYVICGDDVPILEDLGEAVWK